MIYGAQYDYIDTDKAEEKGIKLKENYAYTNPQRRSTKKHVKNPDRIAGAVYEDAEVSADSSHAHARDIMLKDNYAYRPTMNKMGSAKSLLENTQESQGEKNISKETYAPPLASLSSSVVRGKTMSVEEMKDNSSYEKDVSLKSTVHNIYAPPTMIENPTSSETSTNEHALGTTTQLPGEDGSILSKKDSRPPRSSKPSIKPREMYAPPSVVGMKSQSLGGNAQTEKGGETQDKKSNKGTKTSQKSCKQSSAMTEDDIELLAVSSKSVALKQEYTYITTTKQDVKQPAVERGGEGSLYTTGDGYVGPVVPPEKHTEGISLKQNYAYTITGKQSDACAEAYAEGYVGPVVPPVKHTEGIALKDNYAYKATSVTIDPKKKRARNISKKKIDNSDLRKAYN